MKSIEIKEWDLQELKTAELQEIEGGRGFWYDVFYGAAATVHFIGEMLEDAVKNPIRPSTYK